MISSDSQKFEKQMQSVYNDDGTMKLLWYPTFGLCIEVIFILVDILGMYS